MLAASAVACVGKLKTFSIDRPGKTLSPFTLEVAATKNRHIEECAGATRVGWGWGCGIVINNAL